MLFLAIAVGLRALIPGPIHNPSVLGTHVTARSAEVKVSAQAYPLPELVACPETPADRCLKNRLLQNISPAADRRSPHGRQNVSEVELPTGHRNSAGGHGPHYSSRAHESGDVTCSSGRWIEC